MSHDEFLQEIKELVRDLRRDERKRACQIVRNYEVYSPYIVVKNSVDERKKEIIQLIMGDLDE